MLSHNNRQLLTAKLRNRHQHFALRKLTVGVASVLVGLTFMGFTAHADTTQAASTQQPQSVEVSQPVSQAPQSSAVSTSSAATSDTQASVSTTSGSVTATKAALYGNDQVAPQYTDNSNRGSLDQMQVQGSQLQVSGWHATNQSVSQPTHMIILYDQSQNRELARKTVNRVWRNDVAQAYPGIENANQSGFSTSFNVMPEFANDNIQVVSRWTGSMDGNSDFTDYWFPARRIFTDNANRANLDSATATNGQLTISGWHATNQSIGKNYHYIIVWDQNLGHEVARQLVTTGQSRNDVAQAFPGIYNANNSGFKVSFNISSAINNDNLQFISRWTDDPAGNGNATDYWFGEFNLDHGNYANLDNFSTDKNGINVAGWHASNQAYGKNYHYIILLDNTTGKEIARQMVSGSRQDVANVYPTISNAINSGFNYRFNLYLPNYYGHQLQLVSRWTNDYAGNGANTTDYWFAPQNIADPANGWGDGVGHLDGMTVYHRYDYGMGNADSTIINFTGWWATNSNLQKSAMVLFDNTNGQKYAIKSAGLAQDSDGNGEINGDETLQNSSNYRSDVYNVYGNQYGSNALYSGFNTNISFDSFNYGDDYTLGVYRYNPYIHQRVVHYFHLGNINLSDAHGITYEQATNDFPNLYAADTDYNVISGIIG